jgi:hypothetical protein
MGPLPVAAMPGGRRTGDPAVLRRVAVLAISFI